MRVAIMQPYIFPYIGYFQLLSAVDTFVFLDDVNFINKGFINRNTILINNVKNQFTVPLKKASQNKLINEIQVSIDAKWLNQFLKTIEYNYSKAPYYNSTRLMLEQIFNTDNIAISEMAIRSIRMVHDYLEMDKAIQVSSVDYASSKSLKGADRLIEITKRAGGNHYINPSGGKPLYDKSYFKERHIKLSFIENEFIPYPQFNDTFVSGLSIIDLLMFNSVQENKELLNCYKLN